MWKPTVVFCFAILFHFKPVILVAHAHPNIRNATHEQIQIIQQNFKLYAEEWNVPDSELIWDPTPIDDNSFLTELCLHNVDGNYQNPDPDKCNQFFMCSGGSVYVWTCPAGGSYDPISDQCVYKGSVQAQCPWKSIWLATGGVSCQTVGQRPYWSYLTLPKDQFLRCSQEIYYCLQNDVKGDNNCAPGFGYSKCFLACIRQDVCNTIDDDCNPRP